MTREEEEGDEQEEEGRREGAPSFEAVLPAASLRAFARVLQFLGRIGEDLFLEVDRAKVLLSTINASRSAFAIATFKARVFERIVVRGPPTAVVRCKIFLKAFAVVFKTKPGLDNVERCVLSCAAEPSGVGTFVRIKLHCKHGIVKTFKVIYESCDPVHAVYDRQHCSHTWQASQRAVAEWLQHFLSRQDEVSMACGPNHFKFRTSCGFGAASSHDELKRVLHTEVSLNADDFDVFQIPHGVSLMFNLKEFKGILTLAEALQLPVSTHFQEGGSPILFAVDTASGIKAELVLATVAEGPANQIPTAAAASMAADLSTMAMQAESAMSTAGLGGSCGVPSSHVSETSGIQPSADCDSYSAQILGPRPENRGHGCPRSGLTSLEERCGESGVSAQMPLMCGPVVDNVSPRQVPGLSCRLSRSLDEETEQSNTIEMLHASQDSEDEDVPPSPPRKRGRSLFY